MSTLYNLEPTPTAKVLLHTTQGTLALELFASQTPLASRNFLQLCLENYYVGTIFHRVVPGFIVQGGDPTGTGYGGTSIYDNTDDADKRGEDKMQGKGGRGGEQGRGASGGGGGGNEQGFFADEFHSRLKFNRRALVGMANSGSPNTNGSQFFITLGKAEELTGKNTLFGKVVDDSVFTVLKMGEAEIGVDERPLYPTRITGTEVLVNPFGDMVARVIAPRTAVDGQGEKKGGKKKGKKKEGKMLLSFGEDEGEDKMVVVVKKAKYNTKLINVDMIEEDKVEVNKGVDAAPKDAQKKQKPVKRQKTTPSPTRNVQSAQQSSVLQKKAASRSPSSSPEPVDVKKVTSLLDSTNAQIAELKASMKRTIPAIPSENGKKKSALEQMIPENSIRARKRKHGHTIASAADDKRALDVLTAFKARLDNAPPESVPAASPPRDMEVKKETQNENIAAEAAENDEEAHLCDLHFIADCQSCQSWDKHATETEDHEHDQDKGWLSHALTFQKDRLGKDLNWKKKNEELVVIDPREKMKGLKEEQKAKRGNKKGGTTAWDRERDKGKRPVGNG